MNVSVDDFGVLAEELGVDLGSFALALVADGSGYNLWKPGGWAVAMLRPATNTGLFFTGGNSGCTNNYSELEPFLFGLWRAGREWTLARGDQVLCVTDSQMTAYCGSGRYERSANGALWAQLEWYEKGGVKFDWRWVRRNSNPLNTWCDWAADKTRLALNELQEEIGVRPTTIST